MDLQYSNFDVLRKKKCFSALAGNYHGDGETEPWPLTRHAFRSIFFSLRECSISDLLRNPPIYRIKNLRKRKEILSPLYRIAIMRNIQIFNTFVIKSPVL